MHGVAVRLESREWLLAWREDTSRLVLELPVAPAANEPVAVRVQLSDRAASATVEGVVVGLERIGPVCRVEVAPEEESLPAVRMLGAAARGEPVRLLERPPRYRVRLPVVVYWSGGRFPTSTLSISEGGCALRWSGPAPTAGQTLNLSLVVGARAYGLRGVVCWNASSSGGRGRRAGLRLLARSGAPAAWRQLLADAARSGAAAC